MKNFLFFAALILIAACVKERIILPKPKGDVKLYVNEIVSSGSTLISEFGTAEDWFEIYNDSEDTFKSSGKTFYLSDTLGNRLKYKMPAFTIKPKGHLVIFCDGNNTVATQIHTNFKLSSAGENVLITYIGSSNDTVSVDTRTFGSIPSGKSDARVPDGSSNWKLTTPTSGAPNQ
jgi:hypothetical protein